MTPPFALRYAGRVLGDTTTRGRRAAGPVLLAPLLALGLCACPGVEPAPSDGGAGDSGVPLTCDSAEACRAQGFDGVCRASECLDDVPCADDVECGLGERCVRGACRFRGCTADGDCASGRCLKTSYACAECGQSSDCPRDRPVCDTASNTCVQCESDLQCPQPGPGHCDRAQGACVYCLEDKHCPNGLGCGNGGLCRGAPKGSGCPDGIACARGLACVQLGGVPTCLDTCSLYRPADCPTGEICFKLTFSDSSSLVFEDGEPRGVCYQAQAGLRGPNELCARTAQGSNCQPNLECIPESATASRCRRFCDPNAASGCAQPDLCHPFVGDYQSHPYGVCYPDNGFGEPCVRDAQCRSAMACMPWDDPSNYQLLSPLCQFALGTTPGLGPCADVALGDGGVLPASRTCRSGACVYDPLAGTRPNFCFSACAADADCSVAGREGYCDTNYDFPAAGGNVGTVRGCRPRCRSDEGCDAYDAGFACRLRLSTGFQTTLKQTCAAPPGMRLGGEACTLGSQCRSGYCQLVDSRGVSRQGTCVAPCTGAPDCAPGASDGGLPDGGTAALRVGCDPTTLLGFRGYDGVVGTADDTFLTPSLCAGGACVTDEDCGDVDAGLGGLCVPEYDALDAGRALVLRCRLRTAGTLVAGDACTSDADCASGVCGTLQAPSTGTGRTCLRACDGSSACPTGLTCQAGALRVGLAYGGAASLDSCAP